MDEIGKRLNSCFVQFLKTNDAYVKYKKECNKAQSRMNLTYTHNFKRHYVIPDNVDSTSAIHIAENFIMASFGWSESVDGTIFWNNLYVKWKGIMTELKNNNYEISKDISCAILTRCD